MGEDPDQSGAGGVGNGSDEVVDKEGFAFTIHFFAVVLEQPIMAAESRRILGGSRLTGSVLRDGKRRTSAVRSSLD